MTQWTDDENDGTVWSDDEDDGVSVSDIAAHIANVSNPHGVTAAQTTFVQSGSGASPTNLSAYLNLKVKGLRGAGADGTGTTSCVTLLSSLLADNKIVEVEGPYTFLLDSNVVMPAGSKIIGQDRYHSKFLLSGDIEGITVGNHCEVENLRIIGNTSMTTDAAGRAKACLLLGTPASGISRFRAANLILGGPNTSLGDAANARCTGAGLKTGLCFLFSLEDIYAFNADIGVEGFFVTDAAINAARMAQIECHSNRIGARLGILNAVTLDTWTLENNDEEGLILGGCRSVDLINPYFELNNQTTNGARRADLLIEGDTTFTGTADVGGSVRLKGGYFSGGTNALYGIYADKQRGIEIDWPYMIEYSGATNTIYVGDNDTSGELKGFYNNSSVGIRLPANFISGNYEYTGVSTRGQQIVPVVNSKQGATAALAPAGTEDLFTPSAGETYLLTIFSSNNNSGFHWSGIVTKHSDSGTIVVSSIDTPSNISVAGASGAVRMTNDHASATIDFLWSAIRLK